MLDQHVLKTASGANERDATLTGGGDHVLGSTRIAIRGTGTDNDRITDAVYRVCPDHVDHE
ncbi:MAG TPA: hypothetical protein VN636_12425 [Acidimicrobiia bacterium]|nr:hypothetical protein [Acidimicrobiia bacterium]